ncbi:MAG: FUSC family protein [Solirubrobacterales bacterium]|nr:FUSC family protein [Solirubrobacterales bacterium]
MCGTALVLLFSPRSNGGNQLNAAASALAGKLADVLDAAVRGGPTEDELSAMVAAKHDLIAQFTSTPYRPTGLAATDQALANCVELLEWTEALISDAVEEQHDLRDAPEPDFDLLAISSSVLRDSASLLEGGAARPDIDGLERCRAAVLTEIEKSTPPPAEFRQAAQISFHANAVAVAVLGVAYETMVASQVADPEWLKARRARWYTGSNAAARTVQRVSSVATAAYTHASLRSVWFVNSLRGAVALAVAVAVADVTTVQHGFWVVLGTLSVLRTNASATGATAIRALAGTAIGFVIGGALVVAIGGDETALWIVFPFAVLVAAYAPGTAPFAVGQAAFTVLIAILFNLIVPVGWKVGVVRIEDVAIGCLVSAVIGTLFWPRGISSVVGDDLADAFRLGAMYLTEAVQWATGTRRDEPDDAGAAATAGDRLDEGLRGFLSEQGSKRIAKQDLWRLVGGSMRLRLTAHAVSEMPGDATGMEEARDVLERRTATLTSWYDELAEQVGKPNQRTVAELKAPSLAAAGVVDETSGSYYGVWLCEHLDHLSQHTADLLKPAVAVANLRRRPWWR